MHSPLNSKVIIKLPPSVSGEPLYLMLDKALNGLREGSLCWLQLLSATWRLRAVAWHHWALCKRRWNFWWGESRVRHLRCGSYKDHWSDRWDWRQSVIGRTISREPHRPKFEPELSGQHFCRLWSCERERACSRHCIAPESSACIQSCIALCKER